MSGFSAEWLALREPADWRARSTRVAEAVLKALPVGRSVRAIDLAAGTGSNARFLTTSLPVTQEWLLVDQDAELLARARSIAGFEVATRAVDFSSAGELANVMSDRHLVTASALLDLVSEDWLQSVCAMCRQQQAAVLFALSYDGRISCSPEDSEDELIRYLVNRHQQTDKGFGPALGPVATAAAARILERLGYQVVRDRSDWVLHSDSEALQRQLIGGWAEAAAAMSPADAEIIGGWRDRRFEYLARGWSDVVVGHEDLGAFIA